MLDDELLSWHGLELWLSQPLHAVKLYLILNLLLNVINGCSTILFLNSMLHLESLPLCSLNYYHILKVLSKISASNGKLWSKSSINLQSLLVGIIFIIVIISWDDTKTIHQQIRDVIINSIRREPSRTELCSSEVTTLGLGDGTG